MRKIKEMQRKGKSRGGFNKKGNRSRANPTNFKNKKNQNYKKKKEEQEIDGEEYINNDQVQELKDNAFDHPEEQERDEENDHFEDDEEEQEDEDEIEEQEDLKTFAKLDWKPINVPIMMNAKSNLSDLYLKIDEYQPKEGEVFDWRNIKKNEQGAKKENKGKKEKSGKNQENAENELMDDDEELQGETEEENLPKLNLKESKSKSRGSDMDKQFFPRKPQDWNPSEEEMETLLKEMSEWSDFHLDPRILKALHDKNFKVPTEIQKRALISSLRDRKDIIGAAETGSGKTLAFGIPLLQIWWQERQKKLKKFREENSINQENLNKEENPVEEFTINGEKKKDMKIYSLILTPTRELAVQITEHLEEISKYLPIRILSIIGGIAEIKQQRLLNHRPEIIVATPGK